MTRINLVNVEKLSDQHLIAEYRELPRVIKQDINIKDASETYCLGKGHMKWAKKHSLFCVKRYKEICEEMLFRGFKVNFPCKNLFALIEGKDYLDYEPTKKDYDLSNQRILEKINQKPDWYKWTKRS